jgi:hypothetical protein
MSQSHILFELCRFQSQRAYSTETLKPKSLYSHNAEDAGEEGLVGGTSLCDAGPWVASRIWLPRRTRRHRSQQLGYDAGANRLGVACDGSQLTARRLLYSPRASPLKNISPVLTEIGEGWPHHLQSMPCPACDRIEAGLADLRKRHSRA